MEFAIIGSAYLILLKIFLWFLIIPISIILIYGIIMFFYYVIYYIRKDFKDVKKKINKK